MTHPVTQGVLGLIAARPHIDAVVTAMVVDNYMCHENVSPEAAGQVTREVHEWIRKQDLARQTLLLPICGYSDYMCRGGPAKRPPNGNLVEARRDIWRRVTRGQWVDPRTSQSIEHRVSKILATYYLETALGDIVELVLADPYAALEALHRCRWPMRDFKLVRMTLSRAEDRLDLTPTERLHLRFVHHNSPELQASGMVDLLWPQATKEQPKNLWSELAAELDAAAGITPECKARIVGRMAYSGVGNREPLRQLSRRYERENAGTTTAQGWERLGKPGDPTATITREDLYLELVRNWASVTDLEGEMVREYRRQAGWPQTQRDGTGRVVVFPRNVARPPLQINNIREWYEDWCNRHWPRKTDTKVPVAPTPTVMDTLVGDAKESAFRAGVGVVRKTALDALGRFLAARGTPAGFLETGVGQGFVSLVIGTTWVAMKDGVPGSNHDFGDRVAKELRVQGGTDMVLGFFNGLKAPTGTITKELVRVVDTHDTKDAEDTALVVTNMTRTHHSP